jgi:hypothetical protein
MTKFASKFLVVLLILCLVWYLIGNSFDSTFPSKFFGRRLVNSKPTLLQVGKFRAKLCGRLVNSEPTRW